MDVQKIVEAYGMPMQDPAEMKRLRDLDAARVQAAPPPATPTEGRRAHVTQTGFDRETQTPVMTYHEVGEEIQLGASSSGADGDFVASLPRTPTFSDRQVVAAARDLRGLSQGFLSWAYTDFARHLGKQKSLDLSVMLAAESDLLDEESRIKAVVDKIIAGWRPLAQRITTYRTRARASLARVYDRTATVQSKRVKSKAKTSPASTSTAAKAWLDDRSSELVDGLLETTRAQLAATIADGVRSGASAKDMAAAVREHFSDFPQTRASMVARTEVSETYNNVVLDVADAAGVSRAQLIDGDEDECAERNGRVVTIAAARKERLLHPQCQLSVILLPASNLSVRHEELEGGVQARYDADTETILLSPQISQQDQSSYLVALGDAMCAAWPYDDQ